MVVTCTGGERGDVLNATAQELVDELGLNEVRRREMAEAASILGVRHEWLGFMDSGFTEGEPLPDDAFALVPLEISVPPLVKLIRQFRPHVVTTYDENGGYPHPDHIRCHQVAVAAFEAAADSEAHPDSGMPWTVSKLYYNHGFIRERMQLLQDEHTKNGQEGPFARWLEHWDPDHDPMAARVTTRVHCADFFHQRDDALRAHATQIDPAGFFFATPMEWQKRLWPTEEFELARTRVPADLPEDDLFAGIEVYE